MYVLLNIHIRISGSRDFAPFEVKYLSMGEKCFVAPHFEVSKINPPSIVYITKGTAAHWMNVCVSATYGSIWAEKWADFSLRLNWQ